MVIVQATIEVTTESDSLSGCNAVTWRPDKQHTCYQKNNGCRDAKRVGNNIQATSAYRKN